MSNFASFCTDHSGDALGTAMSVSGTLATGMPTISGILAIRAMAGKLVVDGDTLGTHNKLAMAVAECVRELADVYPEVRGPEPTAYIATVATYIARYHGYTLPF